MKLARRAGATSEIWQIFIQDSTSTTGAGLAGLTSASAGLTAYYHRDTDTTATAITLVTMTVGTFTSSGFKEIDATNMPGWYQFCPPNAAIAAGAKSCAIHLKGATNMAPLPVEVDLDAQVDAYLIAGTAQTGRDLGLALPAAAPNAAGGLLITAAGSLDMDELNVDIEAIQTGVAAIPTTPLLAANVPANFSALLISAGGHISNVDTLTTNSDKTGYSLVSTGLDLVLVDGKALPLAVGYIGASAAGKVSGAGSGTEVFKGLDGATTRLTVTVDASGNRSAIVYG